MPELSSRVQGVHLDYSQQWDSFAERRRIQLLPRIIDWIYNRRLKVSDNTEMANNRLMHSCLAMWLVTAGFGGYVYKKLNGETAIVRAADSAPARVVIKGFAFDPKDLKVAVGTEVEWVDESGRHSVKADDGSFDSGILTAGGSFKHVFDKKGSYRYYCEFHGAPHGKDMAGVVTVR